MVKNFELAKFCKLAEDNFLFILLTLKKIEKYNNFFC